jgi:signal transduction histidine kinase
VEPADTRLQHEQRELLARDLHDLTITRLSWLSFELAAVATSLPSRQVPNLIQAISELDDILGDLRQFVLGSFERGPATSGLEPTLRHLAEYAEARMGRPPRVELDGDDGSLPYLVATHTRAVLTEAVHNAVEHAQATRLELQVRVSADRVEVRVADDGTGPPLVQAHGLGLGSMATRARDLHGTFAFRSRSPRGAVVEWCVPMPPDSRPTVPDQPRLDRLEAASRGLQGDGRDGMREPRGPSLTPRPSSPET